MMFSTLGIEVWVGGSGSLGVSKLVFSASNLSAAKHLRTPPLPFPSCIRHLMPHARLLSYGRGHRSLKEQPNRREKKKNLVW